ncbi:flagellar export protein FliJ [Burkholderia ubonensis]|uniref:Flagellar FliJ protein n=1 Tax=Burkholderia ubonensis TaxID=101571 RepID=A0AAW3NC59_9BURK|nr:flagellar export protein FliJ [Burkholderia ubonensis]KVT52668.1 flagellar export protein FliJ [Burkholderia ubonensis]KVZ90647.1 flagellar export protein FliJ [Burkholderia ubonensis]KWE36118.1 flagellar export protein FliJ [Burkholderia ubonensis]
MAQGFPLQILLDRANEDLDSATRQLGVAQRERTDAANQLDSLLRYRDEYHARFAQSAQHGMPAGNWRNFHAFLDTLDAAIAQQRNVLAAADARIDEARPHWQLKKRTVGSYEILQARGVAQEAVRTAKREQREADEHAAKILRMRADAAKST